MFFSHLGPPTQGSSLIGLKFYSGHFIYLEKNNLLPNFQISKFYSDKETASQSCQGRRSNKARCLLLLWIQGRISLPSTVSNYLTVDKCIVVVLQIDGAVESQFSQRF
jgi:hypothetical protein